MEKTFLRSENLFKKFFYYFSTGSLFIFMIILNGCTPSESDDSSVQRARDSVNVYSIINSAFSEYKLSLLNNQNDKLPEAKQSFEKALKILKDVKYSILQDTLNKKWKDDYDGLAISITQDYIYTQQNIPESSLAFKFAKSYKIKYETINLKSEVESDLEPLPDGSDVPLEKNNAVDEYIEFFSKSDRGRSFIDKTLYRSGKYFPLMRKILRFHNTPEEMIYLSVQESGLNPTIVSKAGAVGLWQFMPATGKSYGLYQDGYRDDRRDIEKSTDAAARHLKDLYRSFGDWYLAWAAYNAGPGRVNSAISKSGSKNYWELRGYLPGETKNYVPSILALSFVFRNPEEYGFKDIEYGKPLSFERVNIKGELTLDKVAEFAETDIESIRDLNTELTSDNIPNYDVPYQLRLPTGTYDKFIKNYKNSYEYRNNGSIEPEFAGNESSSLYNSEISVTTYSVTNYDPGDQKNLGSVINKNVINYILKKDQSLNSVADTFKIRVSDIRLWNNLSWNENPKPNQTLNLYLTKKQYNDFYNIEDDVKDDAKIENNDNKNLTKSSGDDVQVIRTDYGKKDNGNQEKGRITDLDYKKEVDLKKETKVEKKTDVKKNKEIPDAKLQTYMVQEGDYISAIAEKYGVSSADIREWNDITGDKIIVGQKLKIYSNKIIKEKSVKNKNDNYHIVEEGEFLSSIAEEYDVSVADLMEWNNLENDKILTGQKLLISKPKEDNKKNKTSEKNSKSKVHIVKEGENLTQIAEKYNLDIDELKEWNDLKKDVIVPGQKLIVSKPSNTKNTKSDGKEEKKKTYKVKKGDKLSVIAEENDVSVKELIKWNDLDSDGSINIGQVLKLYDPNKKENKKSNKKK